MISLILSVFLIGVLLLNLIQIVYSKINALQLQPYTYRQTALSTKINGIDERVYSCMPRFYVTGYFTPIESDYSNNTDKITIDVQDVGEKNFIAAFIKDVKIEGWGKTLEGWYVGYHDKIWFKSSVPLGINDRPLAANSAATDPKVIPSGSKLIITTLHDPQNKTVFSADDIGKSIKGKHIDIYTGEGKPAQNTTFEITGRSHSVCLIS